MTKKILCLFLIPAFLILSSCVKNNEQISWRQGDDIRSLSFLNDIETPVPQPLTVLNERIEFTSQVYEGLKVENTFVKKINSRDGALLAVDSHYNLTIKHSRPNLKDFKKTPGLLAKVRARFPFVSEKDLQSLEAVIDPKLHPVWTLSYFSFEGAPHVLRFDQNLKLLSNQPAGANLFDGAALVFPHGPKFSELKEVTLANLSFQPALSNPLFSITSALPLNFVENSLRYGTDDPRFDQVQVYFYVGETLNWIRKTLGVDLSMPLEVQLHIGAPKKTNAAFYYQGKIRLGAGDDEIYSKIPQDPSIVSHEVFHSLIETLARLPYEGEGGSLNEAFADFFTAQMRKRPALGESSYLQGPFKRSVANSKEWSDRSGGLYGDSLIISGLLWDLSENIGEESIRRVALKTLGRLNPVSRFVDFNRECRSALTELLSGEDLARARAILSKRGFPP